MSYFSYHNRLKQLLETEKYICVKETGKFAYRFIFPRLMKSYPIREYRLDEYMKYIPGTIANILNSKNICELKIQKNGNDITNEFLKLGRR